MDPDDRAFVVALAESVLGPSERRHRWPFLVDDDGAILEVDAWWPARGAALAIVGDAERWSFAGSTLGVRGIALISIAADALPIDEAGGLLRDEHRVAAILVGAGFPVSAEEAVDDGWSPPRPAHGAGPLHGWWVGDAYDDPWNGGGVHGEMNAFDDDAPDLDDDLEEDDVDPPGPGRWGGGPAAPVDLGWRARPIAMAALGAAVTARRVFARDALDGLDPVEMELLVALLAPDDTGGLEDSGLRGLSSRLVLEEPAVRRGIEGLVERGLVRRGDRYETSAFAVTIDGRATLLRWLGRVGVSFSAWPASPRDVDDGA